LQTKFNESYTASNIFWNVFDYEKIPDTELNITTSGNSKLSITFEGVFMIRMGSTFIGDTRYNITLDISGVRNHVIRIFLLKREFYLQELIQFLFFGALLLHQMQDGHSYLL